MSYPHTAVWIDHQEARVFHVSADSFDEATVQSPQHKFHRHPKGPAEDRNHPEDLHHFFEHVIEALADSEAILLLGPSTTKIQFLRWAQEHKSPLAKKIVGIESADHPTDKQIVAHVKHYFGMKTPRV